MPNEMTNEPTTAHAPWKGVLRIGMPVFLRVVEIWRCHSWSRRFKTSGLTEAASRSLLPITGPRMERTRSFPRQAAIKALWTRGGADRPILVVHVDQAANDFNAHFDAIPSAIR